MDKINSFLLNSGGELLSIYCINKKQKYRIYLFFCQNAGKWSKLKSFIFAANYMVLIILY